MTLLHTEASVILLLFRPGQDLADVAEHVAPAKPPLRVNKGTSKRVIKKEHLLNRYEL